MTHHLILGGARSGKSRFAEQLATRSGRPVTYIATCQPGKDAELAERIAAHQARRPESWAVIEEPPRLAATLQATARDAHCILVDCLTLWITNLLLKEDPHLLKTEQQALVDTLPTLPGQILLISNEVGQGITPVNTLSRRFIDQAGELHQTLAQICHTVTLVTAGLPQKLK